MALLVIVSSKLLTPVCVSVSKRHKLVPAVQGVAEVALGKAEIINDSLMA